MNCFAQSWFFLNKCLSFKRLLCWYLFLHVTKWRFFSQISTVFLTIDSWNRELFITPMSLSVRKRKGPPCNQQYRIDKTDQRALRKGQKI